MRIAIAQVNPKVGDIKGNEELVLAYVSEARKLGVKVIIFPELVLTGYPPEDLLFRRSFVRDNLEALNHLISRVPEGILAIIGFVRADEGGIYNSAAIVRRGELMATYDKTFLPNYGVFDEFRYFTEGTKPLAVKLLTGDEQVNIGVAICEDIWYPEGPSRWLAALSNAHLIAVLNASPFEIGKPAVREEMIKVRARDSKVYVAYANLVGAQDELIFDGHSVVVSPEGEVIARAPGFEETLLIAELQLANAKHMRRFFPHPAEKRRIAMLYSERYTPHEVTIEISQEDESSIGDVESEVTVPVIENEVVELSPDIGQIYSALVLGVRDYFRKTVFRKAVIGVSGGMDSALVTCIAADALGAENVYGVIMPSRYTSKESLEDAEQLIANLGVNKLIIPIDEIYVVYLRALSEAFRGYEEDITEQNVQARIRGNLLMAIANKYRALVIATSNKSESSVGYATLYGDTCGAIAPLKDVYKTTVYKLAEYRNSISPVIPHRIFVKPPSAELKPEQRDEDELMPYKLLDRILKGFIEQGMDGDELVASGLPEPEVNKALTLLLRNEYKRRQTPPGFKISSRAFGKDWRYPIVNGWSFSLKRS